MDRRKIDIALSAILILVSIIILTSDKLVEGGAEAELSSMFLPRLVAVFIIILALTIATQSFMQLSKSVPMTKEERIDVNGLSGVFIYTAIFVAYWLLVPHVGFVVATPFVMIAIATLLGGRRWVPMVLVSVITPLLIDYGTSHFLRIFLPSWSLS